MRSVVKLDIDVDRPELAKLIADPKSSPKWMDDVRRVETLSGRLGATGSRYVLVPKQGGSAFVATIVSRDLPNRLRLSLDAPRVTVTVNIQLIKLSANRTRLVSEQTFRLKSPFSRVYGFLARLAIRRTHRRHMESLKLLAEGSGASTRTAGDA